MIYEKMDFILGLCICLCLWASCSSMKKYVIIMKNIRESIRAGLLSYWGIVGRECFRR